MKNIILFAALSLCFHSFSAAAQEDYSSIPAQKNRGYVAVKAGVSRMKIDGEKYNKGAYGAALGLYVENNIRVEGELMAFDDVEEKFLFSKSKRETTSLMLNVYYDFLDPNAQFRPYVGVGAGGAYLKDVCKNCLWSTPVGAFIINQSESKVVLAASLQVGAAYRLSKTLSLDINGRYTYLDSNQSGYDFKMKHDMFTALAGLRFDF